MKNSAEDNKGKWILAVIICGAAWVGVSPFIGVMLAKDKHLELSGKPPEPLDIGKIVTAERSERTTPSFLPSAPTVLGKADGDAIRERFHQSIISTKPAGNSNTSSTSSSTSSVSSSSIEDRLKQLTALFRANKDEELLGQVDKFIDDADRTPGNQAECKILADCLAMQSAARLHKPDLAKSYGQKAKAASRASGNYLMRMIDAAYYGMLGSKVDFVAVQKLVEQYEADAAASRKPEALAKGKQLLALTDSLPAESYYRMQARIYRAYSQFNSDGDEAKARRELLAIKKDAVASDDKDWAKVCDNLINTLNGLF